jgi:hypothetical protein
MPINRCSCFHHFHQPGRHFRAAAIFVANPSRLTGPCNQGRNLSNLSASQTATLIIMKSTRIIPKCKSLRRRIHSQRLKIRTNFLPTLKNKSRITLLASIVKVLMKLSCRQPSNRHGSKSSVPRRTSPDQLPRLKN